MKVHLRHASVRALAQGISVAILAASSSAYATVGGWGSNTYGQTTTPASASAVVRLAAGWEHSVGLRTDGVVVAWGRNNHGESVPPASIGVATQVAAGWDHSVALRANGTVVCFGAGSGQSGFPHYGQSIVPSNLGPVTQVAAGGYHTLALRANGTVAAWGLNNFGQIDVPAGLGVAAQVGGGNRHSVARRANGTILCWGDAQYGQCTPPAGLGTVAEIDGGGDFTIARMQDGTVRCWGRNDQGQCNVPAALNSVTAIAGGLNHSVAVRANGTIVCWGRGIEGQTSVPGSVGVATAVAAGSAHSIAVHSTVIPVPGSYPTIQSAIDAVPAGAFRVVSVAAGTRTESFSLNGKNVVVRGAPGGATILDGTGLPSSIATFAGNEPSTAGLEDLVFRNGTAGTPINPPSYPFTGGGAVFGKDSAAFIRNCSFTDCGADFGAGAYLLRCTMEVAGCDFVSNDATTDGGGMQAYASSGTVRNCVFTGNRCAQTYAGSGSAFKAVGIRTAGTSVTLEGCTISGNPVPGVGAAVEYFENTKVLAGTMRLVDTDIVDNLNKGGTTFGAAGLRVIGSQQACVLSGGATVCGNTPRDIEGPFLATDAWTVCDCLGDLTGDGGVDAADLGIVLGAWASIDAQGTGDVNHDGQVDAADLSALLAGWGDCD